MWRHTQLEPVLRQNNRLRLHLRGGILFEQEAVGNRKWLVAVDDWFRSDDSAEGTCEDQTFDAVFDASIHHVGRP